MTDTIPSVGLKIMYVDDDPADLEIFSAALKDLNTDHTLCTASNCMEVLDCLTNGDTFDIIFMDINMPLMDGKQCLHEIKKKEGFKNIPVIILSGTDRMSEIDEVYSLGAHYHIVKPHAYINLLASLKIIFSLNWKEKQPVPEKDKFLINFSFVRKSDN